MAAPALETLTRAVVLKHFRQQSRYFVSQIKQHTFSKRNYITHNANAMRKCHISEKLYDRVLTNICHLVNSASYSKCYTTTAVTHKQCWQCGKSVDIHLNQRFCECGLIQAPHSGVNHFQVMEVEESFEIDTEMLTRKFRELQKHLHPDKFSTKSEKELDFAEEHSSLVNKAYETLLNPLSRAIYLLKIHGLSIEESEIQLDPTFLMEILEVNERLSEAEDRQIVEEIGENNSRILHHLLKNLSDAFKNKDLPYTKVLLARLKYHANIQDKVREKLRDII